MQSVAVSAGTSFDTLLLNLSSTIGVRQIVTVSYEVPDTGTVIADVAGNEAAEFDDFPVTNNSTVANITPPIPASAEVQGPGETLNLTFNEDLDIAAVPSASAFTVKADGVEVPVQSVLAALLDTLTLSLSATIKPGQTVTVSYEVPDTGTVIADTDGNPAVAFTDFPVTNNSTVDGTPQIPASAEVQGPGETLNLTFNEDLDIAAVPSASAFIVKADGVEMPVQSVLATLLDTLTLSLSATIKQGQTVTVDYKVPTIGLRIADVTGNEAVGFTDFEVDNNSTVDGTPPIPESAEVQGPGETLNLTFNEDLDIAAVPPASAFTVKADGVEVAVQFVTATSLDTLALSLSATIGERQIVTVSYTVPPINAIADVAGNDALAFTDFEVTNNSTVANTTPPVPASAEVQIPGETLNLTFNENLDIAAVPPARAFIVKADGVEVPVQSVLATLLDTLTLSLSARINQCHTVTVDYEVPTTNPIQDTDDNDAVGFTDFAVDNNSTIECPNDHSPVFAAPDPRVFSVEENVPLGTDIGGPVTATDADRDTLTYSLDPTTAHSDYFQINAATGQLRTNVATGRVFNHESAPATGYTISVIADDGREGTVTAQITVVVSVTDVDEPPDAPVAVTVTGSGTTSLEVTWTAPSNAGRPDIEHYDVQYREVGASQWRDGPQDVIGTSATVMPVDAAKSYEVQVRATNDEGDGPWAVWGVTITPVTIEAEHEEIGGGLEDLKFTLTREGATTDALPVKVTVVQDQSWLGASDLEHDVTFLAGSATATLTIAANRFSFNPTASGDLTATVWGRRHLWRLGHGGGRLDRGVADHGRLRHVRIHLRGGRPGGGRSHLRGGDAPPGLSPAAGAGAGLRRRGIDGVGYGHLQGGFRLGQSGGGFFCR